MKNLLVQVPTGLQIAPNGGFTGFGKLGLQGSLATNADLTFKDFISSTIGVLTIVAIIWFVFIFITGAISYMSSGGDKAAIESARKKIINGVIGLVLVIIAIFVIKLIGYLIGIPDILNFPLLFAKVAGLVVP
jgi:hypothetical protein